ncbi:GNAT family N-acetyltransferase [Acinetobacter sp. ANC 4648]|uniref:GNAT family N-acetyltransferase n=1 Tax=Acinetobacter sp. ANC 4648 TaxID=1977875 RepID=UPI000A35A32A|nr:N-acetyltransferase [Acinetobacter sp. ANC 4648]OTG81160.1 GNAT family N-acetyltransferase [Acinetobacter sp. ANC 4648]
MLDLIIRSEQQDDIAAIFNLTKRAFENVEHSNHTEQFIVNALRAANALTISLVAEYRHEIVGHVAISPITISSGAQNWYGLGPISVAPEYQNQGIGSALMTQVLDQLKYMDAAGCVVLGDPQYYSKFGFKVISGLILSGVPLEYFQALAFKECPPQGEVKYHPAFEATQ